MMITIFAAVEQVLSDGVIEKAVRTEFYTTREAAAMAIAGWAKSDSTNGLAWEWSFNQDRWQRQSNDRLHVLTTEEHIVLDAPKKDPALEWLTDVGTIITTDKWTTGSIQTSNCMHDNCPACKGTGIDMYGNHCVH